MAKKGLEIELISQNYSSPDYARPGPIPSMPVLQVQQVPHSAMRAHPGADPVRRGAVTGHVLRPRPPGARGQGYRLLLAHGLEGRPDR